MAGSQLKPQAALWQSHSRATQGFQADSLFLGGSEPLTEGIRAEQVRIWTVWGLRTIELGPSIFHCLTPPLSDFPFSFFLFLFVFPLFSF